jgi:glycosyltransferase involved in cell wall biosynthesis
MGPEISVVVTTFERPWHLERVLEALAVQSVASRLEVIVTDDGSRDETPAVVRRFAQQAPFPVRFITQEHDGFRAAICRNRGVAEATAPFLMLLDGDCVPPPRHIQTHLECHKPGVVTNTYCVLFDRRTTDKITLDTIRSAAYQDWAPAAELRKLRRLQWKSQFYNFWNHPTKPRLRSGDVGMLRSDYRLVNGMDQRFRGWGSEDDDLGIRFRAAGLKIQFILDRTRTYHLWHPPTPTRPPKIGDNINVNYLYRPLRLTRCIEGITYRKPSDLSCVLAGTDFDEARASRFLKHHGLKLTEPGTIPADVEVLFRPGRGGFRGQAAVRLLVVLDDQTARWLPQAHIVVSPSGKVGRGRCLRLAACEMPRFWEALGWSGSSSSAAAA